MMTTTRALVTRVLRPLLKAVEGQPRSGSWQLPVSAGWLTSGPPGFGDHLNWWQMGGQLTGTGERSAVVARCISLYAKTTASLPGAHWRKTGRGGVERVDNSALSRILRGQIHINRQAISCSI